MNTNWSGFDRVGHRWGEKSPFLTCIRSDNEQEFIARVLRDWWEASDTTSTDYIEPGSSWEKDFAESFKVSFRDEFLNTELFTTAPEAQLLANP